MSYSDFYTNLPRFTSYNYLRNQRKKHQLDFELNAQFCILILKIIFIYDLLRVLAIVNFMAKL
jgi:hypothetical protein